MPMVDSRCMLPQELSGGHAGLPCARHRAWHPRDLMPEVVRHPRPKEGDPLPGGCAERRPEYLSFSGTENLPWALARARSMGALTRGGTIDKALKARNSTKLDLLVDILVSAARSDRPEELRGFAQPYNPNRHTTRQSYISEDMRRKQVLYTLKNMREPLCDIYDLATCSPRTWSYISRELGGLGHGTAMRHTLEHVQQAMTPMDRASFWTAAGSRQRTIDHYRETHFAGERLVDP